MLAQSRTYLRWGAVFLLVVVLLGGMVGRAQAVEIIGNGTIPAGQTVDDDVVIGGDIVTVDGTVNGTLIAGGQTVTINGTVKSDAILAAQTIIIGEKAVIEGNLFVGAANVSLRGKVLGTLIGAAAGLTLADSSRVGRNLFFGGYSLETKPGAVVTRDVVAGGYQAILAGSARNVEIAAAGIEISGTISGSAKLRVADESAGQTEPLQYWRSGLPDLPASIQPGLRIAESAKIAGKLTYTSQSDQSRAFQSAPGGGVVYQTPVPDENYQRRSQPRFAPMFISEGFWLWGLLRNLVTILLLGALALWLAPGLFSRAYEQVKQRSLASMGVGLIILVAVLFAIPMISIALVLLGLIFSLTTLIDIAGIWFVLGFAALGFAAALFFTLFLWAGKLLLSFMIGSWLLARISPQANLKRFGALALGALVFAMLASLPFMIGFLFTFVVDLAGAGALWYAWRTQKTSEIRTTLTSQ